ncbi:MAG TPA: LacI family DNA-binding transcriptional regulator [Conexibacter sp.]|nr:LacI family DNA-binding transcriptional regulator [Conexibacter sp.]
MEEKPEITIADVARAAGVSVTTVSHALSGNRPVSSATAEKVRAAAAALGYRPNPVAASLRTRRTQTVALVIPDITNPFYPMLARGLQDALAEANYHIFICNTDQDSELERELVADLVQRQVDGVVIAPFGLTPADVEATLGRGVWMVSLGPALDHPEVDVVEVDDAGGAREVARHLTALGHRRIALIAGTARTGVEREKGFRAGLADAGVALDDALVVAGDWTQDGGAQALERLLEQPERPTAVFCANDLMAIGALSVATARGLRVPEDLSIVGFDDVDAAARLTPSLTTVRNPAYAMGEKAGRLVLARLAGQRGGDPAHCLLPCSLVERQSTTRRS